MTSNTKEVSETETFIHELRRQNMNNEYKPVLIYNGNEHDLKNHGELICGGCGYVFSSNEAEELFKNVEFKPGCRGFGGDLYSSAPLCCIQCFQEFEKIYLSERHETFYIYPSSVFKKRYVTQYGELILPREGDYAEFIPSWDPSKRRKMAYIDSIAYMLYSSGIKSDDLKMLIDRDGCALYNDGTSLDGLLYRDINYVSRCTFRQYASQFDKMLTTMDKMENGEFFIPNLHVFTA